MDEAVVLAGTHQAGLTSSPRIKAWLPGTFRGVSPKHLQRYLEEFTYRFSRRGISEKPFFYAARRAMQGEPLTYHRLTAESAG